MKIQEGTWERSREKELIILTGPRETVTGGKRRPQMERSPRERAQPNRWGGERGGWACGPVLLLEFKGEHTAQGERWDLTGRCGCSAVTGGQGKKGNWWQWPAFTLVPLGTMVGCSHSVWECSGSRRIWSFKIYSIENSKICLQFLNYAI